MSCYSKSLRAQRDEWKCGPMRGGLPAPGQPQNLAAQEPQAGKYWISVWVEDLEGLLITTNPNLMVKSRFEKFSAN